MTAYRYEHEALEVISGKAPSLSDVIERMQHDGEPFCCLDGTLIRPDWVASCDPDTGDLLWCSGKHTACGANVQILTGHTDHQVRTSPVEPGSAHDATAARRHVLPALSKAAADGLLALADKGCTGEGIGTSNPIEGDNPCPDNIAYNTIQAGLHASSEGAKAPLKSFKA